MCDIQGVSGIIAAVFLERKHFSIKIVEFFLSFEYIHKAERISVL